MNITHLFISSNPLFTPPKVHCSPTLNLTDPPFINVNILTLCITAKLSLPALLCPYLLRSHAQRDISLALQLIHLSFFDPVPRCHFPIPVELCSLSRNTKGIMGSEHHGARGRTMFESELWSKQCRGGVGLGVLTCAICEHKFSR